VLGVGGAVDKDDAPALHHLAEPAHPLHRRADLHLPPSPLARLQLPLPWSLLLVSPHVVLPPDSASVEPASWLGFGGVGTDGPRGSWPMDRREPGPPFFSFRGKLRQLQTQGAGQFGRAQAISSDVL
jgi:hypothetical protein